MSYSFVDLKKKKNDLTKTQHATSKAAVKTFEILLCYAHRADEAPLTRGKGRHHFTKEIKRSAILGREWEIHSKPLQPRA